MENNGASCSLALASHDSPQQSEWLQSTLADLNKRMMAIITLLKEDGNSLLRDEIYYHRRLELFQMIEELDSSYRSLAEQYDQFRFKVYHLTDSRSLPSFSNNQNRTRPLRSCSYSKLDLFYSSVDSILGDPDAVCDNTTFDSEYLTKLVAELTSTESEDKNMNHDIRENHCNEKATHLTNKNGIHMTMDDNNLVHDQDTAGDFSEDGYEQAKSNTWSELKFQLTKLMEENLQQQTELARRNIEKRLIINRLQRQLKHLKDENRALQSCINCLRVGEKHNQVQIPKLRRMISGKFFGLGCST